MNRTRQREERAMRILVVDDDASVRALLRQALEAEGHAVVEAETWCEATALLDSHVIELAVVDGRFPKDAASRTVGDYGPVLCQQARGMGARTILLSASDALVEQEARAGYPALQKPVTLRTLLAAVAQAAASLVIPCLFAGARAT